MGTANRRPNQCPQCWKDRDRSYFERPSGGRYFQCKVCRGRRGKRRPPRRGLDPSSDLRVGWQLVSRNKKLGPIPVALVSSSTCPPTCGFYGNGCYAEFHLLRNHWRSAERTGLRWHEFCQEVAVLPRGQLWRYGEAGDLPGRGEELDVVKLAMLSVANAFAGARGFAFTHKPLKTELERRSVALANRNGFTINLSAEGLEQADELADIGVGPVAAVVPRDTQRGARTPAGRHVVLCPAETHGITCSRCGLCAQLQRKSVVAFRAHGQAAKTVEQVVQLRAAKRSA